MNTIPSMEEQFISKLNTIVDSNFTNEQFSVSDLASQMGMSRATLHRRLKTISGKPVSQYINERRLAYAKDLLENRAGTVSDIAFMVGFGSSSYFTKCFHDFYGYRPGDLLKEKLPETKDLSENTVARQSKKKTITGILAGIFVLTALVLILALVLKKSKTNIPLHKSDVLSKSPAAVNFYQQGNGLMEVYTGSRAKEHFLEAKDKYEAALRLDSTFGDAYCRLAGIYFSEMSYSSGTGQGNYYSYVDSGKVYLDKAQKFGVVDLDYY